MRKPRRFAEGAFYHVTSRTNGKIHVFDENVGRKIMLLTLESAKEKYQFRLANFCVMPNHIHLLIQPTSDGNLSAIMRWIKTHSAKIWNCSKNTSGHLWGERYFAREITHPVEYNSVMKYIDQNPVAAGLAQTPAEWEASGAFHKAQKIEGLLDF